MAHFDKEYTACLKRELFLDPLFAGVTNAEQLRSGHSRAGGNPDNSYLS